MDQKRDSQQSKVHDMRSTVERDTIRNTTKKQQQKQQQQQQQQQQ